MIIDMTFYSYGAGIVMLPFIVGVAMGAILKAIKIGGEP